MTQGGYDDTDNVGESVAQSNNTGSRTQKHGWVAVDTEVLGFAPPPLLPPTPRNLLQSYSVQTLHLSPSNEAINTEYKILYS